MQQERSNISQQQKKKKKKKKKNNRLGEDREKYSIGTLGRKTYEKPSGCQTLELTGHILRKNRRRYWSRRKGGVLGEPRTKRRGGWNLDTGGESTAIKTTRRIPGGIWRRVLQDGTHYLGYRERVWRITGGLSSSYLLTV